METSSAESHLAWNVLLEIKNYSRENGHFEFLCIHIADDQPHIQADDEYTLRDNKSKIIVSKQRPIHPNGSFTIFYIDPNYNLQDVENHLLSEQAIQLFTGYLSYSLLPYWARKNKMTYAVSHFAQTLDGKIATLSGHSKWIGDQENLIHAHRMRALCDGVLIGGHTLERDHPRLTVRHVQGKTPVKIVIGNAKYSFDTLLSQNDKTLFITSHNGVTPQKGLEVVHCEGKNGYITPREILRKLYDMQIYSVYIEGGAYTSSQFLKSGVLDEIQLYLAPSIMGSGLPNFSLPAVDGVQDAVQFDHHHFMKMGNGVMFAGRLNHK